MAEPFVGQIILFAGNYAPDGWFFCQGQLLQIQQYAALYSILGTTYGGNGQANFNLPDLRGVAAFGYNPSDANFALGKKGGDSSVTLTEANLPVHTHSLNVASAQGSASSTNPQSNYLANTDDGSGGTPASVYAAAANTTANPKAIGTVGASQPVAILSPYLALNYIIAWQGIYPPHP